MVILWYFYRRDIFYLLYIGSLAAVTADTWATEIGIIAKSTPLSILTFQVVSHGISGGVSTHGTLAAALGSLVLVLVGLLSASHSSLLIIGIWEFFIILVSGFLASIVDSLLG